MDYLEIGCSPVEEDCVQVGSDNYHERAMAECEQFIKLLEKKFPDPPNANYFRIKSNPHDFGNYLEVQVVFDERDEESYAYALACEGHTPLTWDDDKPYDWRSYIPDEDEDF